MSHAPLRRTDDAWTDALSHIAADQFVQVTVAKSRSPPAQSGHRSSAEKERRTEPDSAVRRMMRSLAKF